MKQAGGEHKVAKAYYKSWVPEEPVSKFKEFATRVWEKLKGGAKTLSAFGRGKKPGPKPRISDELAIKIGTVYSQRLHWEHGESRHYHNIAEVHSLHPTVPQPTNPQCWLSLP